ncbi:hypothetical protein QTO34_014984 [Cnephaeus nilssonii]|uniref:Uncharacterized protein n=1 Tax=Cnephaeus nilssonii TaxID=3371016 RepID=A0AA40HA85_CNENI|nr:hypothetical protein QTO34_014984 [Eptesicus nilssonii]
MLYTAEILEIEQVHIKPVFETNRIHCKVAFNCTTVERQVYMLAQGPAQGRASTQRGPESAPNFTGPGSEEPAREQRRRPQEPSRPKPQSNLREVACAVPAEAVLIHQSRDRGGTADRLLNHPAGDVLPGGLKGTGQGPGPRGGAKANRRRRRKKKQGHRRMPSCADVNPGGSYPQGGHDCRQTSRRPPRIPGSAAQHSREACVAHESPQNISNPSLVGCHCSCHPGEAGKCVTSCPRVLQVLHRSPQPPGPSAIAKEGCPGPTRSCLNMCGRLSDPANGGAALQDVEKVSCGGPRAPAESPKSSLSPGNASAGPWRPLLVDER